jgi:hypothetical protein
MRVVVLFAGLLSFSVMSNIGAETIYKWVDDDAVTHFSVKPPQGVEAERMTIKTQQTSRQSIQARTEKSAGQRGEASARRQQDWKQATEDKAQAQKNQQIRTENCAKARTQNETYMTSRRLYREGEDGERDYLSDDELDNARAEAEKSVNEWCD